MPTTPLEGLLVGLALALLVGASGWSVIYAFQTRKESRKHARIQGRAMQAVLAEIQALRVEAKTERPASLRDAEMLVAQSMAVDRPHRIAPPPVADAGPEIALTPEEEWALEWEKNGEPEFASSVNGVVGFDPGQMEVNRNLAKSARAKLGGGE